MNKKIKIFDLSEQYELISKEVGKNVLNILKSGQYILGENVGELEAKFSNFIGSKHSVSCNSGTDALILSLRALNIGHGDEVITMRKDIAAFHLSCPMVVCSGSNVTRNWRASNRRWIECMGSPYEL